jgi:hypothetical protein
MREAEVQMVTGTDQADRDSAGERPAHRGGGQRPNPLTDEELERLDRWVRGVIQDAGEATALNEQCAADVARLVAEVHRLRELVLLVYHYVPEREETRELVARLKAEVDR